MNRKGISFLQPKGVDNFAEFGIRLISGINEFIDNAIAAGAKNIIIKLKNDGKNISLMIIEDGAGMDKKTLQYALSFGGENAGIEEKLANDLGKYHAGITIASLGLSNYTYIFSNNGDGWIKNYIDKEEIKATGEIYESQKCDMPDNAILLLERLKNQQGLELKIETGTIVLMQKVNKDIIGPYNFGVEVNELFNNTCMRYHEYLNGKGSIYIIVNDEKDIRKCESIPPLLNNEELLKNNGIEIFAHFKYKDILCIKDVLPYSNLDSTIDIEYVLIRKKNKYNKMLNSHELIKLDKNNQGTYIDRNKLNIIKGKIIGYNKEHDSMNGCRSYINADGNWDTVLGININKSIAYPNSKFYDLLDKRLKKVSSHIRKVLQGKERLNLPDIKICDGKICKPIVIKDLTTYIVPPNNDGDIDIIPSPNNDGDIDIIPSPNNDGDTDIVLPNNDGDTDIVLPINIPKNIISLGNTSLVSGLAFACKGPINCKYDSHNEKMLYERNDDLYLIYDDEISNTEGIRNKHLKDWWKRKGNETVTLDDRIRASIKGNVFQEKVFSIYKRNIEGLLKDETPALLTEVELYHNSYKNKKYNKKRNYDPQRMDFCLLLGDKKILIELDGIQHIGDQNNDGNWTASEDKYSEQCIFDMQWQLEGNEIYRISNKAFKNMTEEESEDFITNFFKLLFKKHSIIK